VRRRTWGGWRGPVAASIAAVFALPLVLMFTGSLRRAGAPPPRTPELLPAPIVLGNYSRAFELVDLGRFRDDLRSLFVYRNAFEYLRYGYASAATVVMFALTALIVLAQWRIVRRWRLRFAV
jgi:hypothetical protein